MDSFATHVVHDATQTEPDNAAVPHLVSAAMFELDSADEDSSSIHEQSADEQSYVCSRRANPTVRRLERRLAKLEAVEGALRAMAGDGLFRDSVGIEDPADLCDDPLKAPTSAEIDADGE